MALSIETFSNVRGGNPFYKAICHPLAAARIAALRERLAAGGPVAVYDPHGLAAGLAALHPLAAVEIAGVFVQDLDDLGKTVLGRPAQPITDLPGSAARHLFVVAFDAERPVAQCRHLVPDGMTIDSLDSVRLPDAMLGNRRRYLDPLNFATNLAFFRDADGQHSRLVTANYWAGYGGRGLAVWFCLFGADGQVLAQWREDLPEGIGGVVVDSAEVRRRFDLGPFSGQLFVHVVNAVGHDVVKYALDTYGDTPAALSCTHDANAWPADLYAGLPAPRADERVVLWLQNSHPNPIPAGEVGLNLMGDARIAWHDRPIPGYGSYPLDVSELLPDARWPQQIEVQAGRHFVRPRYEILRQNGRRRVAHVNVERVDLKPDPHIAELANLMGKGYLLPAPVLPPARYRSIVLPTPMSTAQQDLPIALKVYDAEGREVAAHRFGCLKRADSVALDVAEVVNGGLAGSFGHMELVYDFADGGAADGWLHGIFRYEDRDSGHAAETSFGAHMFNTVLTYRNEPQSYAGPAPGLSTRLFLRLGPAPLDTFCHLIYPASTPWHARSATTLELHDAAGALVASREVAIACSGSLLWRYSETFDTESRARAGDGGYVMVRDATCRLFGYHGLIDGEQAFCLDHMFGF